jgi:hypothetical protein
MMPLPIFWREYNYSQSPIDAEIGAVINLIRFLSCQGVDGKMKLGDNGSNMDSITHL